jgi:hypothetical protein
MKTINQKTIKLLFGVVITFSITIFISWFAIWQGIKFREYQWVYSEDSTLRAFQYLTHASWGLFFVTSPVWCLVIIILSIRFFVKKQFNSKSIFKNTKERRGAFEISIDDGFCVWRYGFTPSNSEKLSINDVIKKLYYQSDSPIDKGEKVE